MNIRKFGAGLALALAASATQAAIAPLTQDTHVREAQPTGNFSTHASLFVYESAARYALAQFDTSGLSGTVTSATLTLQVTGLPAPGSLEVRRLLGMWDAGTVSFSTTPAVGAALDASTTLNAGNVGGPVTLDVSAAVQAWLDDPGSNHGFILQAMGGMRAKFSAGTPTLDVVTTIPPSANLNDVLAWNGSNFVATPPSTIVAASGADTRQPYLAVNHIIALEGTFPSRNSVEPFIAEIIMFAGNFAPRGWAFCDGQLLQISSYSALFSLLGTTYGGDGRTTFALPDLRGRVSIHSGGSAGPGLSPYRLGAEGGSERH